MGRPDYPNCIMTPEVIRGVRERQEDYDRDPERYERLEREQKEERQREEYEERQTWGEV